MRVFAGFLIVLSVSLPAAAQPPARMALADLVAEALEKNPEIAAAQRRYDAARQRPAQERSLPDPMISAGYSSSGRPWPGAGLGTEPTANIGFMVSQEVPYPGKLGLRASMAARDADAEVEQVAIVKRSVAARVSQAYYRLAYTYAMGGVLDRDHDLLETLLKVSENRYSVGHAAQQDVIKAQMQLSIHDLLFARVEQERATREGELNALGYQRADAKRRADELLVAFGLFDAADRQAKAYSGGMRRRLDIAASIVVTPDLLFLDEPTTGLDPRNRNQVWDIIRSMASGGTTVLLTTQYLDEADQLADRIAVIDDGKVIAEGTPGELKNSVGSGVLRVRLREPEARPEAQWVLSQSLGVAVGTPSDPVALLARVSEPGRVPDALAELPRAGIVLTDFSLGQPSLDEVFLALTGRPTEEADDTEEERVV